MERLGEDDEPAAWRVWRSARRTSLTAPNATGATQTVLGRRIRSLTIIENRMNGHPKGALQGI